MKVVINRCYGGFSLSNKAIARLAELQGQKAYFFSHDYSKGTVQEAYKQVDIKDDSIFVSAFNVPDPWNHLPKEERDKDGSWKTHNDAYAKISISSRDYERNDPLLIQVVEELGSEADGRFAELKIVEIPDGIEWEIDEYDGLETIHEKHRCWS